MPNGLCMSELTRSQSLYTLRGTRHVLQRTYEWSDGVYGIDTLNNCDKDNAETKTTGTITNRNVAQLNSHFSL